APWTAMAWRSGSVAPTRRQTDGRTTEPDALPTTAGPSKAPDGRSRTTGAPVATHRSTAVRTTATAAQYFRQNRRSVPRNRGSTAELKHFHWGTDATSPPAEPLGTPPVTHAVRPDRDAPRPGGLSSANPGADAHLRRSPCSRRPRRALREAAYRGPVAHPAAEPQHPSGLARRPPAPLAHDAARPRSGSSDGQH